MENSLPVADTNKSSSSLSLSSSLPTLPFDLIIEILSRLPVKFLLQFRCVCKSWKYLISDSKFAKKHLTLSTTHTLHCTSHSHSEHYLLKSYSLDSSVLTNITHTQFHSKNYSVFFVGSCDGILCLVIDGEDLQGVDFLIIQLWNPSIRKFKEFPTINLPQDYYGFIYGFGYDLISDNYKVVVVTSHCSEFSDFFSKNEVKVHTLGTDSWRTVSKFPWNIVAAQRSGQPVSGTINWSVSTGIRRFIASFDLGNECYQEVLLPDDFGEVDKKAFINLSVFKDCLCIIFGEDVWVMKEYGNKKSWTKLFTISCMRESWASSYPSIEAKRIFEDEQVLLLTYRGEKRWEWDNRWNYISYNRKNDTSKLIEFDVDIPEFCVESLISPCF